MHQSYANDPFLVLLTLTLNLSHTIPWLTLNKLILVFVYFIEPHYTLNMIIGHNFLNDRKPIYCTKTFCDKSHDFITFITVFILRFSTKVPSNCYKLEFNTQSNK